MPDAGPAFALVASCLLFAFMAGMFALDNRRLRNERSEILSDVGTLESLLKQARKNDHRDDRGRFAKAEAA